MLKLLKKLTKCSKEDFSCTPERMASLTPWVNSSIIFYSKTFSWKTRRQVWYNFEGTKYATFLGTQAILGASYSLNFLKKGNEEEQQHCKCFVYRNRRCISAIQIQKQTLVTFTDICVWLITNIFLLFLSKFSCWIYWEIITLC